MFFFFKQKTAYEMRISDWSSDVCSSDLPLVREERLVLLDDLAGVGVDEFAEVALAVRHVIGCASGGVFAHRQHDEAGDREADSNAERIDRSDEPAEARRERHRRGGGGCLSSADALRSDEHTADLQYLMRLSYVVF